MAPVEAESWAAVLIDEFGSFRAALDASPERLDQLIDGGALVAALLSATREAMLHALRHTLAAGVVIGSSDDLAKYLQLALGHSRFEHVRMLYLDVRNGMISDEVVAEGTVNEVIAYPRKIMKRALELDAANLILVHNHPSGDARPSKADHSFTLALARAGESLGIRLQDHVIVGRDGIASLRAEGFL